MALRDLWAHTPDQIRDKHLQQIIAFAGDGKLLDGGGASAEFRAFLSYVPSQVLRKYATECLEESFPNSGHALQDIVNEVGGRLGFKVVSGRYRGVSGQIGHDGLWQFPNGHSAVVEVKTTDAYRIDLNVVANYRRALIANGTLAEGTSSILIVVGRQDTGDMEAQIRGSRHAWDVRLISVDALLRLLSLKEALEAPGMIRKVHEILIPHEFTRLDDIVDLVFSATEEIKQDEVIEEDGDDSPIVRSHQPKFTPVAFHDACIERVQDTLKVPLVRESRATFLSPDRQLAVICSVSKEHQKTFGATYWFAFHAHQRAMLQQMPNAYVAFGCGSPNQVVLIPFVEFDQWLEGMNTTQDETRMYWHVHIDRDRDKFSLGRRKGYSRIELQPYVLPVT